MIGLIGSTAMAGAVGGGGIGDLALSIRISAFRYDGYYHHGCCINYYRTNHSVIR